MTLRVTDTLSIEHNDDVCWTVVQQVTIAKGDNAGKTRPKVCGYYGSLEDALKGALVVLGDTIEADTVAGYIQQLAAIWRDVRDNLPTC